MPHSIVKALADVGIAAKFLGKYYAEQSLKKDALAIKVDGVGALKFPLDPVTIEKLLKVAKPAAYGLRDKTLTDPNVRHTPKLRRTNCMFPCMAQASRQRWIISARRWDLMRMPS